MFKAVDPSYAYTAPSNDAVVSLLIDSGADPNLQDGSGKTPLHTALAGFADLPVVDALLNSGANAGLSDDQGVTPWDLAQEYEALKGTNTYWRINDARFE